MPAVPPTPSTTTGTQMCFSRSSSLAASHSGWAPYWLENSPETSIPNACLLTYIRISASRNDGTHMPMNPTNVRT